MDKNELLALWREAPGWNKFEVAKILLANHTNDPSIVDEIAETAAIDTRDRLADQIARNLPPLNPAQLTAKRFQKVIDHYYSSERVRTRSEQTVFQIKGNWLRLGGEVPLDTELTVLDLSYCWLVLHVLAASRYTALKVILLNRRSRVVDLKPLAKLNSLHILWLNRTQVEDLSPLATLAELRVLRLNNTRVADLAPLAKLEKLSVLSLNQTRVNDLSPLTALSSLKASSL